MILYLLAEPDGAPLRAATEAEIAACRAAKSGTIVVDGTRVYLGTVHTYTDADGDVTVWTEGESPGDLWEGES